MSEKHVKQHIVPETYLKHFSLNEDGKRIFVIDVYDKYRKEIQVKNSGDKIFWEKKFYNSMQFKTPTALEEFFGHSIESFYNELISIIKKDQEIVDWEVKEKLILWIFTSIQRSPQKRFILRKKLDFELLVKKAYQDIDYLNVENINLDKVAKEQHIRQFSNEKTLNLNFEEFENFVMLRRWEIMKCPKDYYWITKDNPGFLIIYNGKNVMLEPSWNYSISDALFYPLSKDYGLYIFPFSNEDSPELNLTNTPITRNDSTIEENRLFNRFSYTSMHRLLISPNKDTFIGLAENVLGN
ncbi:hypothetical protein DR864_23890 [Runella rosea]|uniref:DUF4238 domain-containing protein n=1 Tax=Runella rosea TaxID=2259595 RepID=A0A344TPI8_9BACT|nr:DUF4238 domain-containing protein [Runella rosea]AXE20559.1 hypothetical protein DR864_23890 [Runella rosea]